VTVKANPTFGSTEVDHRTKRSSTSITTAQADQQRCHKSCLLIS